MASTATTRLRLEKQALGENSATWGAPKLNTVLDLVDEAIGGVEAITIGSATTTLTSTNYASDQARNAALVLTGTLSAASSVIVPNAEKVYLVVNNTTMGAYTLTIKTAAGAGVSLKTGPQWVYCDAASVFSASPRLDQLAAAAGTIDMGGYKVTNSAVPTATTDLATKAYVDSVAVTVDASAAVVALQASVDAAIATLAPKAAPTFTSGATLSTGVMVVPLGAVGSPSYTFSGDSNTGIYSSGADSVSLVAGGTARATAGTAGLAVTGTLSASGAVTASSGLAVTGTLSASGATTLAGTATGALTATSVASSGAVSGTTLSASGAATLSSTLAVTSNTTVGGTLGVTGATTLGSLSGSGAASFGSTLSVTGSVTASSTLAVTSNATVGGTLGVTGAASLSSTLGVTGALTASSTVTAGGVILGAAGSVSAPSHSFSGDTNTGMYGPGSDILRLATGGVDRLAIDASGNVGVGYTTPPSYTDHKVLTVKGPASGGGTGSVRVEGGTTTKQGIFQVSGASGDVVIGADALTNTTGTLGLYAGGTVRQTIATDGSVRIGQTSTSTPGYSTDAALGGVGVWGSGRVFISQDAFSNWTMSTTGTLVAFNQGATGVGSITISGSTTSYNTSSDYRLKTSIEPLTGAVTRIAGLKPSRFRFKTQAADAPKTDGFLAHEVSGAVPEAVTGEKDGDLMQQLDNSKIVPLLVAAVQELAVRLGEAEAAIKLKKDK